MGRILVVDDNDEVLSLVRTVAERAGHVVEAVNHGSRFMTAYVRTKPDTIILDVVMPGVDGIELIRWLADVGCNAKIVIMSGANGGQYGIMAASIAQAMGLSKISNLPKPFHIEELRAIIQ